MISLILKEKTKHLHDLVEAKFNSNRIFEGTFTLQDYRNLLQYNYLFLLSLEKPVFDLISEHNPQKISLHQRWKLPVIMQDLDFLQMEKTTPAEVCQVKNEAEAWGILYVMEGASLGGNMIAKQLSKLPEFNEVPFGYFRCYGAHTGSYWKDFKSVLDEVITPEKHEDCISGANNAYQFLLTLAN